MAQPVSCTHRPPGCTVLIGRAGIAMTVTTAVTINMSIAAPEAMTVTTVATAGIAADHGEGRRSFSVGGCRPAVSPARRG